MPEPSGQHARIAATPAAREAVIRLRTAGGTRGHEITNEPFAIWR